MVCLVADGEPAGHVAEAAVLDKVLYQDHLVLYPCNSCLYRLIFLDSRNDRIVCAVVTLNFEDIQPVFPTSSHCNQYRPYRVFKLTALILRKVFIGSNSTVILELLSSDSQGGNLQV